MRSFTDDEILERVASLPTFDGWKKGVYDISIRSKADKFDAFDDKTFTYYSHGDGVTIDFLLARNSTTNAGSYGLKHFTDYTHEGCAVLKSDVIVYDSHGYGLHKGKKPAYRQIKSFPYYRDNNKNERAEEIGEIHTDIIYANIHRAGVNSTVIKNWSVACLVTANEQKFLEFLAINKKYGNKPLHCCILKEWS